MTSSPPSGPSANPVDESPRTRRLGSPGGPNGGCAAHQPSCSRKGKEVIEISPDRPASGDSPSDGGRAPFLQLTYPDFVVELPRSRKGKEVIQLSSDSDSGGEAPRDPWSAYSHDFSAFSSCPICLSTLGERGRGRGRGRENRGSGRGRGSRGRGRGRGSRGRGRGRPVLRSGGSVSGDRFQIERPREDPLVRAERRRRRDRQNRDARRTRRRLIKQGKRPTGVRFWESVLHSDDSGSSSAVCCSGDPADAFLSSS